MQEFLRRTWAVIDLDAICHNFNSIRNATNSSAMIMSVIKADAYGHGALQIAQELSDCGSDWFAVSNLDEALELRRNGIDKPILILGYTPPEYAAKLALNGISQAVFEAPYGKALAEHAKKAGVQVRVHIKIDTGMSRIGFAYHDNVINASSVDEIEEICVDSSLYPEGIFTHFAKADEDCDGEVFTRLQYDLFLDIISRLERRGVNFEFRHCCNSAGIERFPQMHLDMVRPGIILYGLSPSKFTKGMLKLKPAMELKTVVSMVKTIPKDTPISYGGTFVSEKDIKIATVPIGYADGYPRLLSNQACMLVCGKRAPIVGRVCMDQTILDVTDIPDVQSGMTVTAFGKDGNEEITVDELASKLQTINYEIVCDVSRRVPRVYMKDGKVVNITDYII